ncbi:uncharacterized protein LOC135195934 [Macrobrachium nipponense]|uniref:uncharacterized protein LOC135195934 n=1 Tax=Macrobrachium nipponense TaxID=159736 RepID=UPI0030C883D5
MTRQAKLPPDIPMLWRPIRLPHRTRAPPASPPSLHHGSPTTSPFSLCPASSTHLPNAPVPPPDQPIFPPSLQPCCQLSSHTFLHPTSTPTAQPAYPPFPHPPLAAQPAPPDLTARPGAQPASLPVAHPWRPNPPPCPPTPFPWPPAQTHPGAQPRPTAHPWPGPNPPAYASPPLATQPASLPSQPAW